MTWTRRYRATDVRKILGNLLDDFKANQAEILADMGATRLPKLNVYRTAEVRMLADFPHLGCVKRRVQTEREEDSLRITYTLTFELEVATTHDKGNRPTKLSQLQLDVDDYVYAFESEVLNIPNTTLFEGITGVFGVEIAVTSNDPLEAAVSDTKSVFNTQIDVQLTFRELAYS